MKYLCIFLIKFYQKCIAPLYRPNCKFVPTCSEYMLLSIIRFGAFRGIVMGAKRISRCNWFSKGGCDYVPENPKGEMKWLF